MINEPVRARRRSIRLEQYDYAQPGAYFVTLCTQARTCVFGEVANGAVHVSDAGRLVATLWKDIPRRFPRIELDMFVVMPNHIHGIIVISDGETAIIEGSAQATATAPVVGARFRNSEDEENRATTRVAPTIGKVVAAFKSLSTVVYIRGVKEKRWPAFHERLWQRNYYEHVIRDEADLNRIRRYIDENPLKWEFDAENPQRSSTLSAAAPTRLWS
jgi:REP element-mobilizing transposase RayT